jgi:hypothetical protein
MFLINAVNALFMYFQVKISNALWLIVSKLPRTKQWPFEQTPFEQSVSAAVKGLSQLWSEGHSKTDRSRDEKGQKAMKSRPPKSTINGQ